MSIISFKHKFIFLKTKKVAGTSVEAAIRPYTGDEDIVPCVTPRDEYYSASKGYFSKNYAESRHDEEEYTRLVLDQKYMEAMNYLKEMKKIFVSHMNAEKIKKLITSRGYSYDDFYKFTIERHPYSWIISSISYSNERYNNGKLRPLSTGKIRALLNEKIKDPDLFKGSNYFLYTSRNTVAVDKILRYENLNEELKETLSGLGFDTNDLSLPDLKANARHIDVNDVLDKEMKETIRNKFMPVFKLMSYDEY